MSYNTFGRYRYTMKDSTRRALDSANRILNAKTALRNKEARPDLYCSHEGCSWHTGGGDCSKHFREELQQDIDARRSE